MSQLGYIYNSYGTQFNIAVANTYAFNILNSNSNLPTNTIIISAPYDNKDIGSYSLLATDNDGNPVRLTYTIQEGNGLNYKDDHLEINIDNDTIIEKENGLKVNLQNIIDNKSNIFLVFIITSI